MRITAVRLRRLRCPLDPPFLAAWDPEPRSSFEATLVLVETDEGLVGVGSGDTMDGFERFEHLFVGHDPLALERHVRVLETIAFHAGRYWPFEAALWDLAGKAENVSVAQLLGGNADTIPAYASTGEAKNSEARAESVLALVEEGFHAFKLRIDRERLQEGLEAAAASRTAVGDSAEIAVDLNQGWRMPGDLSAALGYDDVRRAGEQLADLGLLWLEEPLPREDVAGYARLRVDTGLRIGGGEMARTRGELDEFLAAGALDVFQPDAVLAVGLQRAREVGERALAAGRWFTPHTWTNGIGLLANLQVAAGVGGGPFLEYPYDPPGWTPARRDFMLAEPVLPDRSGRLAVPDRPGLGIELDEDAVRRFAID